VKVDHIDPIIERVAESTPKSGNQLQPIFLGDFVSYFRQLLFVADNKTKMPAALIPHLINLGHGEELMISELEKSIPFAPRFKFKTKNVFVKRLRLGEVINLDRHVIAPVHLNAHSPAVCGKLSFQERRSGKAFGVQRLAFGVQRTERTPGKLAFS
jgi:hypothetical protein